MRPAAIAAVGAGGRFVTPATFVVILLVSVLVLMPTPAGMDAAGRTAVSVLTAAAFSLVWLLVAVLERRLARPSARLALVLCMLLAASALRPMLLDAISLALGLPVAPAEDAVLRALTNLAGWTLALVGTAVLTDAARRTRETDALLRAVLAELDASADRARLFCADARAAVAAATRALAAPLPPAPEAVRTRARAVRDDARRLAARADGIARRNPPPTDVRRTRSRPSLRLPPWGAATLLYAAAVLPYALRTLEPGPVLGGTALTVVVGLVAETVPRAVGRSRARLAVFAGALVGAGSLFSTVAVAQSVPWPAAAVPGVAFPAVGLALAWARGTAHALARERRRLSAAISRRTRSDDLGTRAARAGLRAAADVLHRDAQGVLVHFAMRHPDPSAADLAALSASLADLGGTVSRAFDALPSAPGSLALDEVLQTWGHALRIETTIAPDARAALDADPALAADALEILAEGMLNVAKHAARREAAVSVETVRTAAGPALRIGVRSPGAPARGAVLRSDAPAARRGARLVADAASTLLSADLPIATTDPVVSTEHSSGAVRGPA